MFANVDIFNMTCFCKTGLLQERPFLQNRHAGRHGAPGTGGASRRRQPKPLTGLSATSSGSGPSGSAGGHKKPALRGACRCPVQNSPGEPRPQRPQKARLRSLVRKRGAAAREAGGVRGPLMCGAGRLTGAGGQPRCGLVQRPAFRLRRTGAELDADARIG